MRFPLSSFHPMKLQRPNAAAWHRRPYGTWLLTAVSDSHLLQIHQTLSSCLNESQCFTHPDWGALSLSQPCGKRVFIFKTLFKHQPLYEAILASLQPHLTTLPFGPLCNLYRLLLLQLCFLHYTYPQGCLSHRTTSNMKGGTMYFSLYPQCTVGITEHSHFYP